MDQKGKLLLANGYIISQVIYLLPLWGGTCKKYKHMIQVVINNTARWITGMGKRTSRSKLMKACKWLHLEELTLLHSLTTLWKIIKLDTPRNLRSKFNVGQI